MSSESPLPGWIRWLLRLLLPEDDSRVLLSEIEEGYRLRVARSGPREGRSWLRRQGIRAVMHASFYRIRRMRPGLRRMGLVRELRHALRRLVGAPAFTVSVVSTVALGIGGTTAVFALVHAVLISPLPYPEPEELVQIYTEVPDQNWNFSMADVEALHEQQTTFEEVAFISRGSATLETGDGAERVRFRLASAGFFPLLGLEPVLGRPFTEEETLPGADPVAVVSHAFWRTRLGGDSAALGRPLRVNGREVTVVGVLPGEVDPLTDGYELVLPLTIQTPTRKGPFSFIALGRVDPGDRAAAAAELRAIEDRIFPLWRDSWPRPEATWLMRDLDEMVLGDTGPALWIMLGAMGLLLLIACFNAANLLVARGLSRQRALAVRAALGASRGRLLQHLLSESVVLATLGAGAAMGLGFLGIRLVRRHGPDFIPRTQEVALTAPVLAFLAATTLLALLLFGLVPALRSTAGAAADRLHSGGRAGTADTGVQRLRRILVAGQFAVTAPLLIGAGLLLTSLAALRGVDPGFEPDRLLTAQLILPPAEYPDRQTQRQAWDRLARAVAALPGVEQVGIGTGRPPDRPPFANNFVLEDQPLSQNDAQPATPWVIAEPGYFRALHLDVVDGRMFEGERDPPRVLLVDEAWERRFYPGGSAVGKRLRHGGCTVPSCDPWTVIGVVEDVRYTGLDDPGEGTIYMNFQRWTGLSAFLVVEAKTTAPEALMPEVRRVLAREEPGAPVAEMATGPELLRSSLREPRYLGVLATVLAGLALLLALVGVYGIMSYFVEQRRKDIGIRLALGGRPGSVASLVLADGFKLAAGGTLLGVALSLGVSGYLEELLFGVAPGDPTTFTAVTVVLLAATGAACGVPALGATRVDPAEVLRDE